MISKLLFSIILLLGIFIDPINSYAEAINLNTIQFNLNSKNIKLISTELEIDPSILETLTEQNFDLRALTNFLNQNQFIYPEQPTANPDFYQDCVLPPANQFGSNLKPLLRDIPKIILSALLSKAESENPGFLNRERLVINLAKYFIPENFKSYTFEEKVKIAGIALSGGVLFANTFLKENDIDFNNFFEIGINNLFPLSNISLNLIGKNIGQNSKDPFIYSSTILNFNNDFSISLSAGSTRVNSDNQNGKQNFGIVLSVPHNINSMFNRVNLIASTELNFYGNLEVDNLIDQTKGIGLSYNISTELNDLKLNNQDSFLANFSIIPIYLSNKKIFQLNESPTEQTKYLGGLGTSMKYRLYDLNPFEATIDLTANGSLSLNDSTNRVNANFLSMIYFSIHPKTNNRNLNTSTYIKTD